MLVYGPVTPGHWWRQRVEFANRVWGTQTETLLARLGVGVGDESLNQAGDEMGCGLRAVSRGST